MSWLWRLLALTLALLFVPRHGRAATTTEDPTERAKALFTHAEALYTLQRYDEALVEYSRAFELKPLPGFLYNIAQCHRQLGHSAQAAHFYRSYLERSPRAPNRDLVRSFIDEMESKDGKDGRNGNHAIPPFNGSRPTDPNAHPPGKRTPVYKAWWLWTATGVVTVGGGLGIGFGVAAAQVPRGTLGTISVGP